MNCAACGHTNPERAKFCLECGTPFASRCASCGVELPPAAKFCLECGTPASGARSEPKASGDRRSGRAGEMSADTRKVVTIVFADLVGSTALHERLEPESARRFMESYYVAMRGAVESQGGTVTQLLGDGVKAVFGIPRVAEDDAIRAVRAAVAMQDTFRALAEQQRGAVGATGLRVAVNTGEVVANDATEIIGDPVNVAARLQEQCKDGDVVVGESTHRLVSTLVTLELLGSFALKGRSEAVKAYRVVSLERPAGAATAPFVGRDEELARLAVVFETAVEKPAAALAVLVGSPGLGKSRLIDEFARRSGESATVIRAHCDAAGGATFAPLAQALRKLVGIEDGAGTDVLRSTIESALPEDADRARITDGVVALVSGSPASPEETFFVVRRLLGALAQAKPVVLVVDDLHWAEPLLLDLVEHLIQWGSGVPLCVLIGARPELRDLRSSLVTPGGLVSDVVTLSGLDAGAAMRLAANVIGATDLPAAIAAKVLATSEGNPLFVGELVRMLVQEGALTKDGDRWTVGANLAALEMPPTIHALLAARIERLRPEERTMLERAAVVGRHFSRSAVAALMSHEASGLDARLEALRRSELIERDTGWLLGEPVLRFHHVLIRDAAYRRLLKGTRVELHAKLADWIEAQVGDAPEHDETIGWHLEQAHQFLRELGPLDENGKRLGERAAQRLAAAGRRALARDDLPVAADLLGRAIDRQDADDPARADLALDWCEALLAAGDVGPAAAAIDELARFSAGSNRLKAWHTCFVGQHTVLTAPSALHATADAVAAAAESSSAQGDAAGEAKGHFVHALALARLGKVGACEAALDRALAAARRAGDRRRANTVLAMAPLAALWGPSPVTRASGRCLDVVRVLRITQGAPAVEAVALSCQGVLEALRGRTEAARRMIASARKMVEELGITQRLLEVDVFGGLIDLLEGDAIAAEIGLRGAYAGLRDLGLGIDAARAAALLARALLAQDRGAEAEALSHESEALAGDDLKAAIAWRGVRAEALARRGEHAAAVEFASKAVELAAATDALLDHADARLALAAALRAAGRGREADAEEGRAKELWQAKGATLLAERTAAPVAAPVAADAPRAAHAPRRRLMRPNFAFEEMRRAEAAVAARDVRALETVYRRDVEIVDHQFGITYGYAVIVERVRAVIEDSTDGAFAQEPLASLGDSLALCRLRSTASGSTIHGIPLGATEVPYLLVIEADEQGSARSLEIFGDDKLGEAVVRLYERYAALLPDGPERARAAARSSAFETMLLASVDLDRLATLTAGFESVDHRHLHSWSLRGGAAFVEHVRALHEVAADVVIRVDDVLALGPSALLVRRMHAGTERVGGGDYERPFLLLLVAGADGSLARAEWFDADREAEALARFDALVADDDLKRRTLRSVRGNAATRAFERFGATLAARDRDALAQHFDESLEVVHHPTHATYTKREMLTTWRSTLKAERFEFRQQILASLGDALALDHHVVSVEGLTESHLAAVGRAEFDEISLLEVDDHGRWLRSEIFAADRLGDAIVRLYARYAEQLAEGAARARAEATARSVAVVAPGGFDRDRYAAAFLPDIEIVDHRLLGLGTGVGVDTLFRSMAAWREVGDQLASRPQDVIALTHDALLLRWLASGVGRESGGAFEWAFLRLFVFDADGRVARYELFDDDREAEALARFDALAGCDAAPLQAHRFANAASRANRKRTDCFNARDWAGVEACVSPDLVFDERRRLLHNVADRNVWLEQTRLLFDLPESRFTIELLATRGERLSLHRHEFEGQVADGGGPLALDPHWSLHEVDREGRIAAILLFDLEDADAAYAELDARFASGEGAAHPRALASHVAVTAAIQSWDWDALAARCALTFRMRDHRLLGWGTIANDAAAFVRVIRSAVELAPDSSYRDDHLRICARGILSGMTLRGTRDGGAFENRFLRVTEVDEQGRILSHDTYDESDSEHALARFAVLAAPVAVPQRFENAASATSAPVVAALVAHDWPAFEALFAESFRCFDRRRVVQLDFDLADYVAFTREVADGRAIRGESVALATRGERLALVRSRFMFTDADVGPSEIAFLLVTEVDERGCIVTYVRFDDDDLDAAYDELGARYDVLEAALHPRVTAARMAQFRPFLDRDWSAFAAPVAPDVVCYDHRLLGWGTLHGVDAYVRTQQTLVELAPDTRVRNNHVTTSEHGFLVSALTSGTRDGGAFELPFLRVNEVNAAGEMCRIDIYDVDEVEAALARFAEIAAPAAPEGPFENAASRAWRGVNDAWSARDLERFAAPHAARNWTAFDAVDLDTAQEALDAARAHYAPDFVWDDRRPLVGLSGDLDLMFASVRERLASGARQRRTIVGTAGDRVAIGRVLWVGGPADGRFEVEFLVVSEVNEAGLFTALVFFEPDDTRGAEREAWARWAAIDPVAALWVELLNEIADSWNAHDAARVRASHADDIVVEDRRLAGFGRIEGASAYVDSFTAPWALAPDQRVEYRHCCAIAPHGVVLVLRRTGTIEGGGTFESEYVWLSLARDGRLTRVELFEVANLDDALARFEDLRPDPLKVPPNAATRAVGRIAPLYANADLPALRAIVSDDFVFDDRTRGSLLRGGVEEWVSGLRFLRTETRARLDRRLVATAGDRLALIHLSWQETPGESSFLIERLGLYEIDATGKLRAFVLFDASDHAAAHTELFERYVALGADGMPACFVEFGRALEARDLERARAVLADDFVYHDRRRTGSGRLDGPDAYLASPRAWWELSEDAQIAVLYTVAIAPHGRVSVSRMAGTNLEGGDFESFMIALVWTRDERIAGVEMFEVEYLDAALERLEELRPEPLHIPPTAATRMRDRHRDAFVARDWGAIRALAGADFVFEDRGKRALVRGDVEAWIASMEFTSQPGFRVESTLIGTLGDRIVLDQVRWFGKPGGDAFEFERVRLLEVGADGLLHAVLFFDPEDRFAASVEGLARFAAGEAAGRAGIVPLVAFVRALCDRSWDAVRACFAPDLILMDHRPLSLGTLDREQWIASMQPVDELGDGVIWEVFRVLAWNEQGFAVAIRRFGTIADGGGPFEVEAMLTALVVDGRISRGEVFGEADADRAVVRFTELCAKQSG